MRNGTGRGIKSLTGVNRTNPSSCSHRVVRSRWQISRRWWRTESKGRNLYIDLRASRRCCTCSKFRHVLSPMLQNKSYLDLWLVCYCILLVFLSKNSSCYLHLFLWHQQHNCLSLLALHFYMRLFLARS